MTAAGGVDVDIEAIGSACLVLDEIGRVVTANRRAEQLSGRSRAGMKGENIVRLLKPRSPSGEDLTLDVLNVAAKLPSVCRVREHELSIERADGSRARVRVSGGFRRDDAGKCTGAVLLLANAEDEVQSNGTPGINIVSAVSHELRSPLTSVRGYVTLLLRRWDDFSDEDRLQMLEQVDVDARRIGRLIGELLDVSRLERGRLVLNRVPVLLPPAVDSTIDNLQLLYPALEPTVDVPDDLPPVWADEDKVRQVLLNLIENACKYAPGALSITGRLQGDSIVLELCDKGPGVPDDEIRQLFTQFFRSKHGRPSGTGLGLWISRGIAEAHGGALSAAANVGTGEGEPQGMCFRLVLPVFDPDRAPMSGMDHFRIGRL